MHPVRAEAREKAASTLLFAIRWRRAGEDAYAIAVEGELDLFRAPELKDVFLQRVAAGARSIVVDLSQTTFLDSTAAALLIALPQLIGGRGEVAIACEAPHVLRTLHVTGVDRRMAIVPPPPAPIAP